MLPNLLTLLRIVLAFVTVALYGRGFRAAVAAVALTIVVIWMDALDGWVARRTGSTSDMGALLDITGDRIVENVFWIYFACVGLVSFWVPIVVITRGFLTDTVRALQFEQGKTPFGDKTMMRSAWSRFLVAGRFMRGLYGGAKVVVFCLLGFLRAAEAGVDDGRFGVSGTWSFLWWKIPWSLPWLYTGTAVLVGLTVALCILRGAPVLWDSRELLMHKMLPRTPD